MTPTRSAIDSASSWSWVTNTVVTPSSSWMRRISSRSCSRTLASSADSGSSSSSTRGEIASARASATRCCWPPDIWCGYFLMCSDKPDQVEQLDGARRAGHRPDCRASAARRRRCPARSSSGTGCRTGTPCPCRACWPAPARRPGRRPAPEPEVGWSKPASSRSAVVLPQPDGPSRASISPGSMRRFSPASAAIEPNTRRTSRYSTVVPVRGSSRGGRRRCGAADMAQPFFSAARRQFSAPISSSSTSTSSRLNTETAACT